MQITAKVIADSISEDRKRITTFQISYPRMIHSEFMTHRVFSRNASSSRAIPVKKVLAQVWNDPAMPVHWGQNQSGMQAKTELTGFKQTVAKALWRGAGKVACMFAWGMMKAGLHKQVSNRILEPWQIIHVVVTATEWDNFFELRDHEDAQPEIRELAIQMRKAMNESNPQMLSHGEWHLPYVLEEELSKALQDSETADKGWELMRKVSAARCCRVSYLKHDGTASKIQEDLKLCERLAGARPIHASPFEHQASPDQVSLTGVDGEWESASLHGNFVGWIQYRKILELDFNS